MRNQALPTIMFGGGCQVFCGFLCIGIGGLFTFGVAPCDSLCICGSRIRFRLPGFGHVLYRLLLDLFQTDAEALTFFIQLLLIGFPGVHGLDVTRHQGIAIGEGFAAIDLPIQQVSVVFACIETPFQLVVLVAQFALLGRLNGLLTFQRGFKRQQLGVQLISLFQQLFAAVFQLLDLVHESGLCSIRLGVGCVAGEAGNQPALPRSAEMHSGSPSLAFSQSRNRLHDVTALRAQAG
ncbi:hypothetical protein ALP64_203025 [Pseudomonas syringae pv. actinidiae]|nr:hypothetical protein ALP64_203025 [Pseudomonas syringae pv. actinidiae]